MKLSLPWFFGPTVVAAGVALLPVACSTPPTGEGATSSTNEALITTCTSPEPTIAVHTFQSTVEVTGKGFEHYACRFGIGGDEVQIRIVPTTSTPYRGETVLEESGTGADAGSLPLGEISADFQVGCTAASFAVSAYDVTTGTWANAGNLPIIVSTVGCN